jgi:hypothetical protein
MECLRLNLELHSKIHSFESVGIPTQLFTAIQTLVTSYPNWIQVSTARRVDF